MEDYLFGQNWYDKTISQSSVYDAELSQVIQQNNVANTPNYGKDYANADKENQSTYDFSPQGWFDASLAQNGVFSESIANQGNQLPPPVIIPGLPVTPIFRCKKSLLELAETFRSENRPIVQLLEPEEILSQLISATEYYDGYAELEDHREGVKVCPRVTPATRLNESEQAVIWPLFLLYCERESVLYAEASRGLGLDSFIRPSSEIAQDIVMLQQDWAHICFYSDIVNLF
jgi:hypothetical protein